MKSRYWIYWILAWFVYWNVDGKKFVNEVTILTPDTFWGMAADIFSYVLAIGLYLLWGVFFFLCLMLIYLFIKAFSDPIMGWSDKGLSPAWKTTAKKYRKLSLQGLEPGHYIMLRVKKLRAEDGKLDGVLVHSDELLTHGRGESLFLAIEDFSDMLEGYYTELEAEKENLAPDLEKIRKGIAQFNS